ncbi:MAG: Trm112 family protein [Acidimicrobiales bacterium]
MALDEMLLEILACPEDKGPLYYFEDEESLYNPRLRRRYRILDGIPVMLVDEAESVSDDEHARLMAKAASSGIRPNFEPGPGEENDGGSRPG